MNVINKKYDVLASILGNKLLEALKSNDTFNENDFTGMSFAEDASEMCIRDSTCRCLWIIPKIRYWYIQRFWF